MTLSWIRLVVLLLQLMICVAAVVVAFLLILILIWTDAHYYYLRDHHDGPTMIRNCDEVMIKILMMILILKEMEILIWKSCCLREI